MAELTQDGVRKLAAKFITENARDYDFAGVGEQMASQVDESDFDEEEWEKAHHAIHAAMRAAEVAVSWPEPKNPEPVEPFADRDRWYPVLSDRYGSVEERAHDFLFGDYNDSYLEGVDPGDLEVSVVRRSALPKRDGDEWQSPGSYTSKDQARSFGDSLSGEFEEMDDVRAAWLDAVAVAESRNQRAEER